MIYVLMYTNLIQPPNPLLASDPPRSLASMFVNDAPLLRARHGSTRPNVRDLRRFCHCSHALAAKQPLCGAVLRRLESGGTGPARLALAGLPPAERRDLVDQFDERGVETEHGGILGHRQTKGPATRKATPKPPRHSSTLLVLLFVLRATPRLYSFSRHPACRSHRVPSGHGEPHQGALDGVHIADQDVAVRVNA